MTDVDPATIGAGIEPAGTIIDRIVQEAGRALHAGAAAYGPDRGR